MKKLIEKAKRRAKVKRRIRARISGTPECPRISVYRSNRHLYAQAIDDSKGTTLAATASGQKEFKDMRGNKTCAKQCGEKMGALLKELKVSRAVFDRNGFVYHGVLKEFANALRAQGVKF